MVNVDFENEKRIFRSMAIANRDALPQSIRDTASAKIVSHILSCLQYATANKILAFYPIASETNILPLFQPLLQSPKILLLPKVVSYQNQRLLHIGQVDDLKNDLIKGSYNIPEPCHAVPPTSQPPDLVLVPGCAFTRSGARCGYGGGFYDRLLPLLPNALKLGIAFEAQFYSEMPTQSHDVRLDGFITENGVTIL